MGLADGIAWEKEYGTHTQTNVSMSGIELLLEHVLEQKKAYDRLDVCGLSSDEDKYQKIIMADSIIHTQSRIIEKLMKEKEQ